MLQLTADQVVREQPWRLWIKVKPTEIRPFTQKDLCELGPTITDLEGHTHTVAIGECLCIGPQNERWTCSLTSLQRDRYPITLPDREGFQLYKNRHPMPVKATYIPQPFLLDCQDGKPPLACSERTGGYITWNDQAGPGQDLRVEQGSIFAQTHAHYTLLQKLRRLCTPLEMGIFGLALFLAGSISALAHAQVV